MGASIYEFEGKVCPCNNPVRCHLVATGAQGIGKMGPPFRKVRPNSQAQYKSWFAPEGVYVYEGSPVVAQIFFPFGDASVDQFTDRVALQALIAHYRFELGQGNRVELEYVGSADPSGAASFNAKLAQRRADQVKAYVERGINRDGVEALQHARFKSRATSLGESFPTGDSKADRRVDVVLRSVTVRQNVDFRDQPVVVPGEYNGPLTRKLLFKGYGGGSVSLFKLIGAETQEIEIKNPRTGKSAFYQYIGANVGTPSPVPVGVGLPDTDYTEKEVPIGFGMVDVEDFAGPGAIIGGSAGKGGATLVFSGPKLHHGKKLLKKSGVEFFLTGWNIQFPGLSAGAGTWVRLPYSTLAERQRYFDEQARRRDRYGPKY